MKKKISVLLLMIFGFLQFNAQTYKTGAGVLVEDGQGPAMVGPHLKHFFKPNNAGEFSVLFGGNSTLIQANYQYHMPIPSAPGLQWYVGVGPGILFGNDHHDHDHNDDGHPDHTYFAPSAMIGLDWKIPNVPLDVSIDWRPRFYMGEDSFSRPGRFGAGFRFTFK